MIAGAQGQVRSQIAKVSAEIERQKARALQVSRQLEADVVQPAEAQRLKSVEQARGDAATLVEQGKAEAQSLQRLVESCRKAGPSAKEVLTLQSLLPLAAEFSGARHPLRIEKVTVLPQGAEMGADSLARKLIGTSEQLKAATGLDLTGLASRFGAPARPAATVASTAPTTPKAPSVPPAAPKPPPPPPAHAR
jgi:flotillin